MDSSLKILNIDFANSTLDKLIAVIDSKIRMRVKFIVSSPNVHICNVASSNHYFSNIINSFTYIHPDGIGIYLASKFLYGKKGLKERSTGTDLYFKLFKELFNKKFFLIGGTKDCDERIKEKFLLQEKSIAVNLVGSIYKLFDPIKDIEIINKSGADILMVALGTPRQEEWIIQNKDKVNVPVIIAVGSGLDFLAGVKKRAPLWMQKIGLEWLYRLFQEPKRLWKRYVIGIPVFMFNIIVIKVKLLFKKEST